VRDGLAMARTVHYGDGGVQSPRDSGQHLNNTVMYTRSMPGRSATR
jgi:hypothetical protein